MFYVHRLFEFVENVYHVLAHLKVRWKSWSLYIKKTVCIFTLIKRWCTPPPCLQQLVLWSPLDVPENYSFNLWIKFFFFGLFHLSLWFCGRAAETLWYDVQRQQWAAYFWSLTELFFTRDVKIWRLSIILTHKNNEAWIFYLHHHVKRKKKPPPGTHGHHFWPPHHPHCVSPSECRRY